MTSPNLARTVAETPLELLIVICHLLFLWKENAEGPLGLHDEVLPIPWLLQTFVSLYEAKCLRVLILSCEIASCLPVEEGAQSPESGVYISLFHETGFAIVAI